ncbi:extracellular matrix protein 1 isoform X1 [Hyla sarda]|uniref:extracellular matrix protein 1 isoform X1 n=1 Tax=Hyla sarda TaxID=327740 RepID=UPI0024C46BD9|nr:extracellular matrix protein 1 isoform X1 [Hyla sarda]
MVISQHSHLAPRQAQILPKHVHYCLPGDEIPIADDYDMYQREVVPQLPLELGQVQLPLLIQGEPVLSPRGRRPVSPCGGRQPCPLDGLTDSFGSNLNTFPPGKPNRDNIGNICKKSRAKTVYGRQNLPQTGFSHLSRQGQAINELEEGFTACCRKPDKLRCAVDVWKKTLEDFCVSEFSVKTRHYHCCKKSGSERETCFNNDAPNPSYVTSAALQEISSEEISAAASPRNLKACPPNSPKCQEDMDSKYKLSGLAFPPGEPKSSNIQNICKLRKYRPLYTDNLLPNTGYGHYVRRAKAIQRMEGEFKKCCKTDDVACAHAGWKKVLGKFCAQEQIVKTKHHECCKKRDQTSMTSCFASEAPFPEYDREVEVLNLGNVTEDDLQILCGESKLLSKQKQMPLLVSSIKERCCALSQDEKLRCAAEQRETFIKTLCGPKKSSWKDAQDCCSKDEQGREQCFTYYLQNISMAVSQRTKGQ